MFFGPQASVKIRFAATCLLFSLLTGCTSLLIGPLVDPLNRSLQRQTDLDLVRDGTPTLLLILDGLTDKYPDSGKLLLTATQAYSSYAFTLDEMGESERAAALSIKAKDYGLALFRLAADLRGKIPGQLNDFNRILASLHKNDVPSLFWAGYGWATWVKLSNGSPAALADLPEIEQIMRRVLELDETYYYGAAHIFLGYYYGSRPEILGGDMEKSRRHFERALQISGRNYLMAQVTYAESYARQTFNRELFKDLLTEVLNHPLTTDSDRSTSNQLARKRARQLLAQIDDYF
jgi:tetratricopeptide (TPR) repeat protein